MKGLPAKSCSASSLVTTTRSKACAEEARQLEERGAKLPKLAVALEPGFRP